MSDELHLPSQYRRHLRKDERAVLALLLGCSPTAIEQSLLVEDMVDGGMGSIRFVQFSDNPRSFGKAIAEADYVDVDGVLVSIAVNVDEQGDLYEVDFWKVDFSSLHEYPKPEQLRIKTIGQINAKS